MMLLLVAIGGLFILLAVALLQALYVPSQNRADVDKAWEELTRCNRGQKD